MFPYHYGSHATKKIRTFGEGRDVSIPLWFSRNFVHLIQLFCYSPFPYHYGSHATVSADGKPWSFDPFPYHYGSHEEEPSSTKIMDPSFERAEERSRARSFVLRSDASRPGQVLPSRHPGNLLARIPTFPTQEERRSEIPYRSTTG